MLFSLVACFVCEHVSVSACLKDMPPPEAEDMNGGSLLQRPGLG